MVTEAKMLSTVANPSRVARPTSSRAAGVPGVDAGTLDAEEDEHRRQHRPGDLVVQRAEVAGAAPVVGEHLRVQVEDRQDDEDDDRDDLRDGDDAVDRRGLPDPAADEQVERPQAHAAEHDGQDGVAVAERRGDRPHRRHDQHPVGDVADARAGPVAECGEGAEVLAEAAFAYA
jgi:hypothetical protein